MPQANTSTPNPKLKIVPYKYLQIQKNVSSPSSKNLANKSSPCLGKIVKCGQDQVYTDKDKHLPIENNFMQNTMIKNNVENSQDKLKLNLAAKNPQKLKNLGHTDNTKEYSNFKRQSFQDQELNSNANFEDQDDNTISSQSLNLKSSTSSKNQSGKSTTNIQTKVNQLEIDSIPYVKNSDSQIVKARPSQHTQVTTKIFPLTLTNGLIKEETNSTYLKNEIGRAHV